MWGHFYSRRHGWVNADVNLRRMKVYISPPVCISRINMQLIREKTGKEIINFRRKSFLFNKYLFLANLFSKNNTPSLPKHILRQIP